MMRGFREFKCDECGNTFTAMDIEWNATVLSMPQKCPKCGSMHTMPASLGSLLGKLNPERKLYQKIWEEMDR